MSEYVRVQEFVAHATKVNCSAIGQYSKQVIATGGDDMKVNIWRVGSVENIWSLNYNKAPIDCVCFDSTEQNVVSGARNGSIKVFDLNEGKLARTLTGHQVSVTSMQYHPYGEFLITGSADCTMKFWDLRSKSCVETYTGHKKDVTCVRFSPDGKWVASAAKDGLMNFFDLIATKHINSIRTAPSYINTFEFNPLELAVIGATSSRYVRVWNLDSMSVMHTTPAESTPIAALSIPDSGSSLYTTSRSGVKIWDLEDYQMKESVEIGWSNIADMRVTDDNMIVATSFSSNFVSVWEVDVDQLIENRQNAPAAVDKDRRLSLEPAVAPGKGNIAGKGLSIAEKMEQIKQDYDSYSAIYGAGAKEAAPSYNNGPESKAVPGRQDVRSGAKGVPTRDADSPSEFYNDVALDDKPVAPQNASIIVDFLMGVDFQGNFLSLDACVKLLPIVDSVVTYTTARVQPTDVIVFACYKTLVALAQGFGELIRNTRSAMVAGGVDLSREERLNKCNLCYQVFNKAKQRLDIVRHQYRQYSRVVTVLSEYQRLANTYFP
eukprot:gene2276-1660_t